MKLDQLYHPKTIDEVVGQDLTDVNIWLEEPESQCWMFHGPPGVGKSSAVSALVEQLGIDKDHDLHYLECGSMSKDLLEQTLNMTRYYPWGKWHVIWMEEFERLSPQAQVFLKTRLDVQNMSKSLIVLACSNSLDLIDDALLQRFDVIKFHNDEQFQDKCFDRMVQIWKKETETSDVPDVCDKWGFDKNKFFSMRAALRDMDKYLKRFKKGATHGISRQVAGKPADSIPF